MVIQILEVVRGSCSLPWFPTEPSNNLLDVINELIILLAWVGIIETQVSITTILFGDGEVKPDGFSVTNVEVTIWLWRETSHHSTTSESIVLCELLSGISGIDISTN